MNVEDIRAWLKKPTAVTCMPAGTTRGQLLAGMIHTTVVDRGRGRPCPWQTDRQWFSEIVVDLAELDPRLLERSSEEQVRSALSVILSAILCDGLSCPTR